MRFSLFSFEDNCKAYYHFDRNCIMLYRTTQGSTAAVYKYIDSTRKPVPNRINDVGAY